MELPKARPSRAACLVSLIASLVIAGCQTYEQAPLDIGAHRETLDQRLSQARAIEEFVQRLDEAGADVPDRFSFDDGLSPAEGEVLALFYNPDLRIQRMEAGIALATYETAGLWDDPVFGFDGAEIINPSAPFEFGLGLSFTIPISGRLEVEKERAGAAYEASLRAIVESEWSTRADVRTTWARWSIALHKAQVIEELIQELERATLLTGQLREGGELSRADARVFSVALANQQADLVLAGAEAAEHHAQLLFLLGLPMDTDPRTIPGLPGIQLPDLDDDLDALMIEHNTSLAVRRAAYQTAEDTLRLEIRKQIPDFEFFAGYGSENNDDRLRLGLAIPIPVLNANKAAIAEARAQRELSRALAETTYERISRDLQRARISHRQAVARREAVESKVLTMATEQLTELQRLAELGEVNTFLLFESLISLFAAKTQLLDIKLSEHISAIRIRQLLGPETKLDPSPIIAADDDATPSEIAHSDPGGAQ